MQTAQGGDRASTLGLRVAIIVLLSLDHSWCHFRVWICISRADSHPQAPHPPSPSSSSQDSNPRNLIDEVPWRRVSRVVPRLFVGGLDAARSLRFIAENQITVVLSLCGDFVPAQDPTLGICHARIDVKEEPGADLLIELPRVVAFIAHALAQGNSVLVHSARGQNRAPAVVSAYRT
jgi:hypothetical protein